jgi:ribosomal protein L4
VTGIKSLEKTKDAAKLIQKVSEGKQKLLVVLATGQKTAFNALRNLKNTKAIFTNQLNTYAVIRNQRVVMASEAVDELTKLFINK